MNASQDKPSTDQQAYSARNADYYIQRIDADVRDSLNLKQLAAVRIALESAMPKPSPKIVDLRVNIDLIVSRFYVVLFVGKDRRKQLRLHNASGMTKFANRIAAVMMLIGLNLSISLFIFLVLYLIKSSLGINLFSGHLSDYIR
ncbi:MAG: hypothetical protein ABL933_10510 [Methyloglobulus sp.]|nr:hypothetical protein [Methyloglobulus sp.]